MAPLFWPGRDIDEFNRGNDETKVNEDVNQYLQRNYGTSIIHNQNNKKSKIFQNEDSFDLRKTDGSIIKVGRKTKELSNNLRPFMTETSQQKVDALRNQGLNIGLDYKTLQIGVLQDNGKMLLPLKELIQLPLEQILKNLYSNPDILRTLQ